MTPTEQKAFFKGKGEGKRSSGKAKGQGKTKRPTSKLQGKGKGKQPLYGKTKK